VTDLRNDDKLREQVCDWLRANGIDPKHIPLNTRMSWVDGQLTTDVYLLRGGCQYLDPATNHEVARTTKTFPTSQPPPAVAAWLGHP